MHVCLEIKCVCMNKVTAATGSWGCFRVLHQQLGGAAGTLVNPCAALRRSPGEHDLVALAHGNKASPTVTGSAPHSWRHTPAAASTQRE